MNINKKEAGMAHLKKVWKNINQPANFSLEVDADELLLTKVGFFFSTSASILWHPLFTFC